MQAARDRLRGAAAARRRDVIGELEAAVARVPVPGGPVGAADHRAVPRRAARPTRWRPTSGSGTGWPTSSASSPDRGCRSSSGRSSTTTRRSASPERRAARPGTCRRCRPSWSVATPRSRRCRDLLGGKRLVEIVGPGGIGKTAVAIATGRALGRRARRRLAGPARGRDDGRRGPRHGDRRAGRHRRRGGAARAAHGAPARADPRQLRARRRRRRGARRAPARRRARRCGSCAPARSRSTSTARPCSSSRRSRSPTPSSCSPRRAAPAPGDAGRTVRELCRSLDGLPLAIELAAARTRTLSVEEIARRLDDRFTVLSDPTSRKPERRRALRATIGWSYELLFPDDQRGLWALADVRRRRAAAAVESVLEALDVPAAAAIDVVGRLASRSLVIVDDEPRAALPAARQHPRVRARGDGRGRADRARASPRTPRGSPTRPPSSTAGRAQRAARPSTSRSPGPSAPTSTPRWPGARRTTRCSRSTSPTGSAGPGSSSATAAARSGSWPRSTPPATRRRPATGPTALLLAAWIEASTGHLELAREHVAAATELADAIGDADLQARCCLLPRLRRVPPRRVGAGAGADRRAAARSTTGWTGRGTRPRTRCSPPRAAISAGDRARAARGARRGRSTGSSVVDDPWLHVRRDAMLGELARIEHRFDDAVLHIGRAAETSGRLGFLQTEAYQVVEPRTRAVPGRRLRRPAPRRSSSRSRRPRPPATCGWRRSPASISAACCARSGGRAEARAALEAAAAWHRAAGGGEQAALGDCLLAALDAADGVPGAEERLGAILDDARRDDDAPGRGLRPRRARPLAPTRRRRHGADLRGRRPAHGGRLALHHRARPDRRARGQADRLSARPR